MAWWPWSNRTAFEPQQQQRSSWSISDPAIVELLGTGSPNLAGIAVGEQSVLGLAAVYRAVSLIAGTIDQAVDEHPARCPVDNVVHLGSSDSRTRSVPCGG